MKEKMFVEKGFTYNPETGDIFNHNNKIVDKVGKTGYINCFYCENNKNYNCKSHRLAWYIMTGEIAEQVDHINGIRTDNRFVNLRNVSNQKNSFNRKKVKGYYWRKDIMKYRSYIKLNYKQIHIGYFDTEEEARQAYLNAKKEYHII